MDLSQLKTQFVPHSKNSASVIQTDKLIVYREIIAVLFLKSNKYTYIHCEQNKEFINVKRGGT